MKKKSFINIFAFLLLFLVVLYIAYRNLNKPYMTLLIEYNSAPPLPLGVLTRTFDAYYRGYKVGNISKISLSKDQKTLNLYLDITYKDLKLPKNTMFTLRTEQALGMRVLQINYPTNPDAELLTNGDIVYGEPAYLGFDQFVVSQIQAEKIRKLLDNMLTISNTLSTVLQQKDVKLDKAIGNLKTTSADISSILGNIKTITGDNQTQHDIKATINYTSKSTKSLSEILQSPKLRRTIDKSPETINNVVKNIETMNKNLPEVTRELPGIKRNIETTNSLLLPTNSTLDSLNSKLPTMPAIPTDLFENANTTLKTVNCLGNGASDLLSKKYLIPKLIFGRPGTAFKKCSPLGTDCYCNSHDVK